MKEDIQQQWLDFRKKMSRRGDGLKTSRNITMNRFDCSEASLRPPNMPERTFSQYSTMKQFHVGSSIETVGLRLEKARDLQQNHFNDSGIPSQIGNVATSAEGGLNDG